MTDQAIINFDSVEAEQRKESGLGVTSLARKDLLEAAKTIAVELSSKYGEVTSDDVFAAMRARGMHPECLGNAAGAVFRGSFTFTGKWKKSARVTNHARMNRVWVLNKD
jgi:hypothetical protein